MINIAICDDYKAMTSDIEERLYKIAGMQNIKINCEVFFDGSTLIENIQQGSYYDLIYLDIEMNIVNGIKAAETIRNMDIPALIVYVTGYETYLKEMFNTEPFRFLSKPIDTEPFYSIFMAAYKRIQQRAAYFSFTYNKAFIKIPLNSISYFESRNRVVHIHMTGHLKHEHDNIDVVEDRFYGKINDVEKQLSAGNSRFIRIHHSFLVNFDYIKSMSFTCVYMSDGTVLQISKDRQKNVRAQFCAMAGIEMHNGECL